MKHDWEYKKLGEVCESELGKTLNQSKDSGNLRPYLCAINIQWDTIDLSTIKQARFEDEEVERYSVEMGDLLICEGGDTGRAAIWNGTPMLYQNALHRVRFNSKVTARFALMYLRYLKNIGEIDSKYSKGVTIKHLVKSSLMSIPIPIPPLPIQQQIVAELDKVSEIIEKKKQQVKELDNLAQSIFYDMFGDPVENEKGWEVRMFQHLFKLRSGDNLVAKNFVDGQYPVYGGNGIAGYHNQYNKDGRYVVIGRVGVYCGNVRTVSGHFWLTDNAFEVIYSQAVFDETFLKHLLNTIDLHQYSNQAAQPVISNTGLKDIRIPLPPLPLQQSFAQKVEAIEKQKELITASIKEAQTLFDARMDYWFGE